MPILPCPLWPLAGHARLGQNTVVGALLVLRVTLGNLPRGVCLDPRLPDNRSSPRLRAELPYVFDELVTRFTNVDIRRRRIPMADRFPQQLIKVLQWHVEIVG